MSIVELGALGEFVAAIAVVITLIYLAIQVRLARGAVDESRQAIVAQTAQTRMYRLAERREQEAESEHIARIMMQLEEAGFPDDPTAVGQLEALDQRRIRSWFIAYRALLQNSAHQLEIGYETEDLQEFFMQHVVRQFEGPMKALDIEPTGRALKQILADAGAQ